jgi:hypothetical protein
MSLTNNPNFEDSLVNIKQKGAALVKILDEEKTAKDLLPYPNPADPSLGELPGLGRKIYHSIYMTYSGIFMNPTKEVKMWTDEKKQTIKNLNAVIELAGGTNLFYKNQNEKGLERFAPIEPNPSYGLDQNTLRDLGYRANGTPIIAPPAVSYGSIPGAISDPTYDYNAGGWMTGLPETILVNGVSVPYYNPTTVYVGDRDTQDIIIVGQKPDGNGGFSSREILEIVNVRVFAVAVGAEEKKSGAPRNFESVVIAFDKADPRFNHFNSISDWQTAATAATTANPNDTFLSVTLSFVRAFVRKILTWPTFEYKDFKDISYANRLIRFHRNRFLAQE